MKISGHKTRADFDRYNIVSESDLADAALKLESGKRAEVGQNVPIPAEPITIENLGTAVN